MVIWLRE